jgi:hypothetical protein
MGKNFIFSKSFNENIWHSRVFPMLQVLIWNKIVLWKEKKTVIVECSTTLLLESVCVNHYVTHSLWYAHEQYRHLLSKPYKFVVKFKNL